MLRVKVGAVGVLAGGRRHAVSVFPGGPGRDGAVCRLGRRRGHRRRGHAVKS